MADAPQAEPLIAIAEDVLSLLDRPAGQDGGLAILPDLIEQCEAAATAARCPADEPVRLLHHFACTGGTLIAKCLAVMPNTVLLSEIDPLSHLGLPARAGRFFPTDIILGMRTGIRTLPDELVGEVGVAQVKALRDGLMRRGQRLVIRDHPHSHFCTKVAIEARPTIGALLQTAMPVRSLVTVRHPADSFLSLQSNGWTHFSPFTLEEYCRRYALFLDAYPDAPVIRYEDFTKAPESAIQQMCEALDLPYRPGAEEFLPIVSLSGDSGRKGNVIAPRSRRAPPDGFIKESRMSLSYAGLCERLAYDPRIE